MKEKKIAVIGLGYVGLPLAVGLSKHFTVVGFDVNEERITQLNNNKDNSVFLFSIYFIQQVWTQ